MGGLFTELGPFVTSDLSFPNGPNTGPYTVQLNNFTCKATQSYSSVARRGDASAYLCVKWLRVLVAQSRAFTGNAKASMLYLEQPAGVGFSYCAKTAPSCKFTDVTQVFPNG